MKRFILFVVAALVLSTVGLAEVEFAEQYGVKWFGEGALYGLQDAGGNVLLKAQFSAVGPFSEEWVDGRPMAKVRTDSGMGLVDTEGSFVVEPIWSRVVLSFGGAICVVEDKSPNLYHFIDVATGEDLGISAEDASRIASDRLSLLRPKAIEGIEPHALFAGASDSGRCAVVDAGWNLLFSVACDAIYPFSDGMARVRDGKAYGYIRADGTWLSEPQWAEAEDFSDGYAMVSKKEKFGFLDTDGNVAFDNTKWNIATSFLSGAAFVYDGPLNDRDSGISGIASEWKMIDTRGNVLLENLGQSYKFANGLAAFSVSGLTGTRYGYLGADGNIAIEPAWSDAKDFGDDGLALVQDPGTGLYGYIDKAGAVAIPCRYERAEPFFYGLAEFRSDDELWGYVDTEGNVVVEPVWSYTSPFDEFGFASVGFSHAGTYHINRSGGVVGRGYLSEYAEWW